MTIPALNDSRYIGLSVYIVFICCTLGSLVAFIPSEQIQLSYFLISVFIVTCTTVTVCFVFVPKVSISIVTKKQPIEEKIFRLLKFMMTPIRKRNNRELWVDYYLIILDRFYQPLDI